ncbi:FG-GAP-like repeat-containing protein [Streptomyces sp. NPDC002908]|uniref:C40 family peptidase n=2 Tax=unclassified Streptomyces TaxID=2593676 RepID=UPI0036C2E9B1
MFMTTHSAMRRVIAASVALAATGVVLAGATVAQAAPSAPVSVSDAGSPGQGPYLAVPSEQQGLARSATAMAPEITRSTVISRAKSWVGLGLDYNQGGSYQNYRTDCSGYVSMAWKLSASLATNTFAANGVTETISKSELKAGDALLDDDSGNGGHVVLFEKWADSSKSSYMGLEFSGSGVHYREIPYPYFSGSNPEDYVPVRNKSVIDDAPVRKATHDFTGDNLDDLLGVDADNQLNLYKNSGDGSFSGSVAGSGWGSMVQVAAADFDGDGDGDVVSTSEAGDLYLYIGNGAGRFGSPTVIGHGWGNVRELAAGDVTGDGKADIVTVDGTDAQLRLYTGSGGDVDYTKVIGTGWGSMTNLAVGDVTGDRKADVVANRSDSGELNLYASTGSDVNFKAQIGSSFHLMNRLTLADINADGKADVVATGRTTGDLNLYTSSGGDITGAGVIGHGWNTVKHLI